MPSPDDRDRAPPRRAARPPRGRRGPEGRRFGPYTLVRRLGVGARGLVYEAVQRELERPVALKVLRQRMEAASRELARFRREARALARVQHPAIVQIYDAGVVRGRPYVALAHVAGRSLDRLAEDGTTLSYEELARGLAHIADALEALHAVGIVHRDVKPANIVCNARGRMVLTDLGLAHDAEDASITATDALLGTPHYMSPERFGSDDDAADPRADVYGLGATLYTLLVGHPPFEAPDLPSLIHRIQHEAPRPPEQVDPAVPTSLSRIALKALAKDPEDRFPTAAAMRDALLDAAEGRAVETSGLSSLDRLGRRARTHAVAIVALLALGVLAWAWWSSRPGAIEVDTVRQARVFVDGADRGPVPQRVSLPAGRHEVALQHELFHPWRAQVQLESGDVERLLVLGLIPRRPDDARALELLGELHGLDVRPFPPAAVTRGRTPRGELRLMRPRGRVRFEDLDTILIELESPREQGCMLVFRRGEEVLHRMPFDPERRVARLPFPAALREALEPGDVITWGCEGDGSAGPPARFEVAVLPDPLAGRLSRVQAALGGRAPAAAVGLVANDLLEAGFAVAAYRMAREAAATEAVAERPTVLPFVVMEVALRALEADGTATWNTVYDRLQREFTEADRAAWYGGGDSGR